MKRNRDDFFEQEKQVEKKRKKTLSEELQEVQQQAQENAAFEESRGIRGVQTRKQRLQAQFLALPPELITRILGNLDGQSLSNAAKTSRFLYACASAMQAHSDSFNRINPTISLIEAARHGNIRLVKMLFPIIERAMQGQDCVLTPQIILDINTIFQFASWNENRHFLSWLLSCPKIVQAVTQSTAHDILRKAMQNDHYDYAMLLLSNPTLRGTIFTFSHIRQGSVSNTDALYYTLLLAARANRADIAQILLDMYQPSRGEICYIFEQAQLFDSREVVQLFRTHQNTALLVPDNSAKLPVVVCCCGKLNFQ